MSSRLSVLVLTLLLLLELSLLEFASASATIRVSARNSDDSVTGGGRVSARDVSGGQMNGGQDPASFVLEMALQTPGGMAANWILPNTVKGLQTDASNTYSSISKNLQNGFEPIQSGFSQMGNAAMKRYGMMSQGIAEQRQQLLNGALQAVTNPQQFCTNWALQAQAYTNQAGQQITQQAALGLQDLGQSVDSGLTQAGSMANQAGQQSGSLINKLGSYTFG